MTHRVEWSTNAKMALLEMWATVNSSDFERISRAVNELESRLSSDPLNEGEGREGDVRIAFENPIGITFVIEHEDHLVQVVAVWQFDSSN